MIDFRRSPFAPFRAQALYITLTLVLLCIAAPVCYAQDDPEEIIRVESNLVQLNVGVVDRQGRAITNLSRNDFVVFEDGMRQPILNFEPTQAPFSLVLLLDLSGSTLPFRSTLKQAALRFIDALAIDDRVAVIAFNEKVDMLTNFTSERKKIAYAIDMAQGKGGTELFKALSYSLEQLAKEPKRRKAIVVMSDGL